jgi:hypothetical protein
MHLLLCGKASQWYELSHVNQSVYILRELWITAIIETSRDNKKAKGNCNDFERQLASEYDEHLDVTSFNSLSRSNNIKTSSL